MAPTADPWGQTPLTAEGLATQGHPLSLTDFNQDANGYWRVIRGEKTYYPREWFDANGTFTGTGTQAGDRAGQDEGFFKRGTRWNWQTGEWENPTNWANVIGVAAAGGVGAGIAAPAIAGALGGGAAAGGGVGPLAGGYGAATTSAAVPSALAAGGAAAAGGAYSWLGPVVGATLNTIGTQQKIGATEDAAQKQLEATKYAADQQYKAQQESLAFQRQQAAYDATAAESTRRANYDQWSAKQTQLGSVGQALGLPARAIPAYVPSPAYPGGAAPPPGNPPPAGPVASFLPGAPTPGPAAAWWNPQDPQGSVAALLAGKAPTSQTLLDLKPQIEAAGGQVSPANADGVTSKIYVPGVGWTRVLDGGVKGGPGGGQGTGWTFVPQPAAASAAAPTAGRQGQPAYAMADPLGSVQQYFLDPTQATGQLTLPRWPPTGAYPGGAVGAYL